MMIKKHLLGNLEELKRALFDEFIDVRAPKEYLDDRLLGAVSLPVLSDAERARVGTIYKQENPFKARQVGAALISRNSARHLEENLQGKPHDWRPLIYCWRGGQRSRAFAIILAEIGWRVTVLEGGYKAYRRKVVDFCQQETIGHSLVLIDGNTGTAKTDLLSMFKDRGHQVVDLEAMARHRGSVFGATTDEQPSQRYLESQIAMAFAGFDPMKPVLVEAESPKIGNLHVPPALWRAMSAAPRLYLDVPAAERAQYLVRAYHDRVSDSMAFGRILESLTPIQGKERVAEWLGQLREGDLEGLARGLIDHHYDPRYANAREKSGAAGMSLKLELNDLSPEGLAAALPDIELAIGRLADSD